MKKFKKSKGVTLIELLVILAILALLILAAIFTWRLQLAKGRDARRKADLHHLQNILEDYYNDHHTYPPTLHCGESLSPYLQEIYCGPSGDDYDYETDGSRQYFIIYTKLENENDPAIAEVGCTTGCGLTCEYNYGVASQNASLLTCSEEGEPECQWFVCDAMGQCNSAGAGICPGPGCYCNDPNCGGCP